MTDHADKAPTHYPPLESWLLQRRSIHHVSGAKYEVSQFDHYLAELRAKDAQLADAKDDALRLHREKMELWEKRNFPLPGTLAEHEQLKEQLALTGEVLDKWRNAANTLQAQLAACREALSAIVAEQSQTLGEIAWPPGVALIKQAHEALSATPASLMERGKARQAVIEPPPVDKD